MNKKTPIYKLNDRVWDALKRFLSSNNPLSWITNTFINCLWLIGKYLIKLVKTILGKKEYVPVVVEEKEEVSKKDEIYYSELKGLFELNNYDKKLLFIDLDINKNSASGATDYGINKIEEFKSEGYKVVLLSYKENKEELLLTVDDLSLRLDSFNDLNKLMQIFGFNKVFINNLAFYPEVEKAISLLNEFKNKYDFLIEYAFHDYLSVCPSYFLLNEQGVPCDVSYGKNCKECLLNNPYKVINRTDNHKWQADYKTFLENVDKFLFFSNYTKDIISNVYPIKEDRIAIEPHKTLLSENHSKYTRRQRKDNSINIAFVGHFGKTKGADYYIETIERLKKDYKVKSVIIGYMDDEYKLDYKTTGRYNRDDLGYLLTDNQIDLVIFPSFSNETFSYTVQELMILGVPIVVFKTGAPASRIIKENYELAQIADEVSADSLYEATRCLISKITI